MNANISMTPELVKALSHLGAPEDIESDGTCCLCPHYEEVLAADGLWRCADCGAETFGPEPEPAPEPAPEPRNNDYPHPDTPRIVAGIVENGLATNNTELEIEFSFAASELGWTQEQVWHELENCWFPWFRE